jgi:hypothetical protein
MQWQLHNRGARVSKSRYVASHFSLSGYFSGKKHEAYNNLNHKENSEYHDNKKL